MQVLIGVGLGWAQDSVFLISPQVMPMLLVVLNSLGSDRRNIPKGVYERDWVQSRDRKSIMLV